VRRRVVLPLLLTVAVLLTGCAGLQPPRGALRLTLRIDVAVSRMEALPLLLGLRFGPFKVALDFVGRSRALSDLREGRALAAVVPPSSLLRSPSSFTLLERVASADDDVLLWHGETERFRFQDLRQAVVYATPEGAEALSAVLRPYLPLIRKAPEVVPGGVQAFLGHPASFLVAGEALAARLEAHGRAHLAQAFAVETGPWPAAVLVMAQTTPARWPRLTAALVRALWQNAVDLDEMAPGEASQRLQPDFPTLGREELRDAFAFERRVGVLPSDPRVDPPSGSRLEVVFPQIDWTSVLGAVDDRLADEALQTTF